MKETYISKKGYVIKKKNLTEKELYNLKTELTARPLTDDKYFNKNSVNFPVYIETQNKIYIPKMYGIEKYGIPEKELENYIGKSIKFDFIGNLLEHQKEPISLLLEACYKKGGGILSLMTGLGKTFCSIYAISKLKGKTIIIVNKISLLNQWKEEIHKFSSNNVSISILQGSKINYDEIVESDIIIAMLQSLNRIDYPDYIFNDISTTIFDEVHNISSREFSKVLFKLSSKYTIGLSATPKRSDGCEYVFKWHLGDIVYKSNNTERKGLNPIIRYIKINTKDYKEFSTINKMTGQKQIQYTTMLSDLIQMPKRNQLILSIIKELIKENRKILVLSDRRNHLSIIKNLLDNDSSITFTYGFFLGKMKSSDLEKSKSCQVILASFAAFSEGVNEKNLDSLVLITPKKYIGHMTNITKNDSGRMEQVTGRIFRKKHIERHPIIIDIFDNFSVYKSQGNSRKVFYKKEFTNGIFEEQSINLDLHENVSTTFIKTKKKIEQKKNPEINSNICLIED